MIRLAVVQFTPEFRNLAGNLEKLADFIKTINADVIVFPEMATTGYFFRAPSELEGFALTQGDVRLQRLLEVAVAHNRVIVFGFPELAGTTLYNSAMIGGFGIAPAVYRKTHLFYREKEVFTPGNTGFFVTRIPHLDINIGTMICYDWRFPESTRTLALRGADLVVSPSNLVTELWPKVMPARAVENKVYLAIANRIGIEHNGGGSVQFNGRSTIYGYNGDIMASVPIEAVADQVIMAELDPQQTRKKNFSAYNDIFADRRPEMYA